MATELIMQKVAGRLVPATMGDAEVLGELKEGGSYRAKLTRMSKRSLPHHKLLFALISLAVENFDGPITAETIKEILKIRTGHVTTVGLATGEIVMIPKTIGFEGMDQDAFNKWFPRAVDVLCRDFVPGLAADLAMREIERRAAGQPANDDRPYRAAA